MKASLGNPPSNALRGGVSELDLQEAISSSGYPLQSQVAAVLRKHCGVREEWGYIDSDDQTQRSMDMLAQMRMSEYGVEPQPRVRPYLSLLVECKRSELPYVFFLASGPVYTRQFPMTAGLNHDNIEISTDDDRSTWQWPLLPALGLDNHQFQTPQNFATNLTRCERDGKKIRLSGSEPYNSLVQPLVKAAGYFKKLHAPISTAAYFDFHLVVPLAVVDAPMIGVNVESGQSEIQMVPWVRVPRHVAAGVEERRHKHHTSMFAVDVVHVGFLEAYLLHHLLPFAAEAASRSLKHQLEVVDGKAFVPGMGKNWVRDIEVDMKPVSLLTQFR